MSNDKQRTIAITRAVLSFSFSVISLIGQTALNNESIEKMAKSGLDSNLIVNLIKSQPGHYSVAPDDLIGLKKVGVPEQVIAAMIDASQQASPTMGGASAKVNEPTDPNDPAAPHSPGIWLFQEGDGKRTMRLLKSASFKEMKTRGMLGVALAGGFAKLKENNVIDGAAAPVRTKPDAVFYIYVAAEAFPRQQFGAAGDNGLKGVTVLKGTTRNNTREFRVMSMNAFSGISGSTNGIDEKDQVAFSAETVRDGVCRITFPKQLAPGEYLFLYANGGPSAMASAQMGLAFDFGIDK